jgi:hypothetical protein
MSKSSSVILLLAAVLLVSECSQEDEYIPAINYIGYGKSFGECLGYCTQSMKANGCAATLNKTGWNEYELLPEIQCARSLQPDEFMDLNDSLNLGNFLNLPDTIGCPDCADGGAEWIEVSYDTMFHRVTFEYMNEPAELAAVLPMLREMMESIPGCEE